MTTRFHTFILLGTCALLLSGCVSREQADAKLAKGCVAGVNAMLPEGRKIERTVSTDFSPSPEGQGMRHVKLKAIENDGFLEVESDFECVFEESFGIFNMGYTASIYQVRTGERVVGKSGDEILGDANDFLKLTDAIRDAMY